MTASFAETLRYRAVRSVSRSTRWRERHFTDVGQIILSAVTLFAVFGIDTRRSASYQAAAFLGAIVVVSVLASLTFRCRLVARRALPRYGSVGDTLVYPVDVENLGVSSVRGLEVREDLASPLPTLEEFTQVRSYDAGGADYPSRAWGWHRWLRLIRERRVAVDATSGAPVAIEPGGHARVMMRLTPTHRGRLRLRGLSISRADSLGIFRTVIPVPEPDSLLVLPRRYPVPPLTLQGIRRYQSGGVALSSSVGESEEFLSLRDYRPGDPMRRIHWKSWPKRGEPVVKELQDEYFVRSALVLDTFAPQEMREVFEEAVSIAASFACSLTGGDALLDLLFVEGRAYRFTAGRGVGNVERLLEVLACVAPAADDDSAMLHRSVSERANEVGSALCILLHWDDSRERMVGDLRACGVEVRVLLVVADDQDGPNVPGVHAIRVGRVPEELAAL